MSKRLDSILQKTAYLKILLPTLLIISLFVISLFLLLIPQFEADIMERKRETIFCLNEFKNCVLVLYSSHILMPNFG